MRNNGCSGLSTEPEKSSNEGNFKKFMASKYSHTNLGNRNILSYLSTLAGTNFMLNSVIPNAVGIMLQ